MVQQSIARTSADVLECPMDAPAQHSERALDNGPQAQSARDYARIEKAIRYLTENRLEQPELGLIAAEVGLSEFHFQRLFSRWAGISPKKFLQYLTLSHARQRLSESASVLDATFDVGLSGPGRLHDLFVNFQQVTPGEYKSRGRGLAFRYAFHPTPFGTCLTVENERGLTGLSFVLDNDQKAALDEQKQGWDQAIWSADPAAGHVVIQRLFFPLDQADKSQVPLSVLMRGTPYQVQVWEGLMQIPAGCMTTYGNLADKIGYGKKAARALGNACGANRIGVLIPCHRVIRDTGVVSGYRWGTARKKTLLALEAARSDRVQTVVL